MTKKTQVSEEAVIATREIAKGIVELSRDFGPTITVSGAITAVAVISKAAGVSLEALSAAIDKSLEKVYAGLPNA